MKAYGELLSAWLSLPNTASPHLLLANVVLPLMYSSGHLLHYCGHGFVCRCRHTRSLHVPDYCWHHSNCREGHNFNYCRHGKGCHHRAHVVPYCWHSIICRLASFRALFTLLLAFSQLPQKAFHQLLQAWFRVPRLSSRRLGISRLTVGIAATAAKQYVDYYCWHGPDYCTTSFVRYEAPYCWYSCNYRKTQGTLYCQHVITCCFCPYSLYPHTTSFPYAAHIHARR